MFPSRAAGACWIWTVTAGLLALASPVRAQTPATVNVSVDATAAGTPLERVWPFHGYDEINYTTTPEGEALLGTIAAAHTAPVHVRSHFLLNTGDGTPAMKWGSTNVYTEDAAGNPVYSWDLTDGIMDTITGVGAFPFVEIGFMPEALSTHPTPYRNSSTTTLDGGCFYPPTDYTKWADLISTWAMHANERYPDVAASWLWELWNEPDIGYWNGTFADYAKLYDYTESALHEVLPNAALGGPAVAGPGGSFLPQFLQHCATGINAVTGNIGTRLDLVTFHAKGGVAIAGDHVEMDLGNQLRLHRAGFNAVAAVPQFKQTPIYVTEADPDGCAACPVSSTPADAYRILPRVRRLRDRDDEAQPRARGRGGRQAGRPAHLGVHVSGHAVFRRVSHPRHERHQPARPERVQAARSPGRDPLAPDQQRGAHAGRHPRERCARRAGRRRHGHAERRRHPGPGVELSR